MIFLANSFFILALAVLCAYLLYGKIFSYLAENTRKGELLITGFFVLVGIGSLFKISEYDIALLPDAAPAKFWQAQYRQDITIKGKIYDRQGRVLANEARAGGAIKRRYPFGRDALLGDTTSSEAVPLLELIFLPKLQNTDHDQSALLGGNRERKQIIPYGTDVILSLDARWQRKALDLLGTRQGSIVALAPNQGDVLVLASSSPEVATETLYPINAAQNRYPLKRLYEFLLAGIALQHDLADSFRCTERGYFSQEGKNFTREAEGRYHGKINLATALQADCKVYFARLTDRLTATAKQTLASCLDLPGSSVWNSAEAKFASYLSAAQPRQDKKSAADDTTASASRTEAEPALTPVHAGMLLSALFGNGTAYKLKLEKELPPQPLFQIVDYRSSDARRKQMISGCSSQQIPREWRDRLARLKIAGVRDFIPARGVEWFVSCAPADRPDMVIVVVVQNDDPNFFLAERMSVLLYEEFQKK